MSTVIVRVDGAAKPVLEEQWPADRAEARAEALREQIRRAGWTHKVEVRS